LHRCCSPHVNLPAGAKGKIKRTGFMVEEAPMARKWVELLTEIAPTVRRVGIMFNPDMAPSGGSYFLAPFEAATRSLKMESIAALVRCDAEIDFAARR
jgi:putative ABC transport system substrate-binding protein